MTTEPVDPRAGAARLGPYRLHGLLGEGGMGVVHLGVDDSGRAVAVKVLRDHVAHDPDARARLAREVATLRRVDHPAVAPFLGADVDGARPYVVTRYVPGDPLDRWVADHGPLRGTALAEFGDRLGEALGAIHAGGVVHRDLKPGNVLMPDGSPVVIDFGIAHIADESRLTSTGLVMGTPGYLAPELLDGMDVTGATDLWGWAATVAFAATGRAPFGTGHAAAVLDRVRRGTADLADLPPALVELLTAGLDPDPARRPSLSRLREDLARAATDAVDTHVVQAPPAPPITTERTAAVEPPAPPTVAVPAARQSRAAAHDLDAPTAATPVVSTRLMPTVPPAPPERGGASGYAGFGVAPTTDRGPYATDRPASSPPASFDPPARATVLDPGRVMPRRRRTGTLLAVGLLLVTLTGYLPLLGLLVALGWSWLARFVDRLISSLALRRHERGPRDRDLPVLVLSSPLHLLSAAFSAVVAGILPLLVGLAFSVGLRALTSDVTGAVLGTASMIMIGSAAALIVGWWGPGSATLRRGSRSVVRAVSPGRVGAGVATGMLVVAAVVFGLLTQSSGYAVSWWPFTDLVAALPFVTA